MTVVRTGLHFPRSGLLPVLEIRLDFVELRVVGKFVARQEQNYCSLSQSNYDSQSTETKGFGKKIPT